MTGWYRIAAIACAASGLTGLAGWLWPASRWGRPARIGAGAIALLVVVASWIARTTIAGHLPLFGTYENALSLALAVLVAAALWEARSGFDSGVLPLAAWLGFALLVQGAGFDPTPAALTISERSLAVDLHAVLAWLAFGFLSVNAALAVLTLLAARRGTAEPPGLARTLELGFLFHTAMLASGSFYKFLLFGKAWSFDPIETLGFAAWVAYGTLLHMRLFAGWNGRRLAAPSLFVFVLLVASYRLIVYFPGWSTYHIFDLDLRIHVEG